MHACHPGVCLSQVNTHPQRQRCPTALRDAAQQLGVSSVIWQMTCILPLILHELLRGKSEGEN